MKQAVDYVNKKQRGKEFLTGFFAAQRLAVLIYCLNLVNPRMKMAIEEAIGEKGAKSVAKNLSNLVRLLKK